MMKRLYLLIVTTLTCALTLQCSSSPMSEVSTDQPNPQPSRTPAELTVQETSLLASSNEFGLNLFREVVAAAPTGENVFISPLSVSYALGLCYDGADGATREEIGATLRLSGLSLEEMNRAYHDLTAILTGADPLVSFQTANSFWSRWNKQIQPEFINLARTYFDARVEEIDFQAPGSADTINAWVSQATNGKITQMVQPPIDANTAAMLFNAIYFKGDWMFPFDTARTSQQSFHLADGSETTCDMMYLSEDDHLMQVDEYRVWPDTNATAYSNGELTAVSLPYGRGDFRMTIVAPYDPYGGPDQESTSTVDDVIADLTLEGWNSWLAGMHADKFTIGLPRFRFECETNLNDVLKALGMEIAFDPNRANFTNLFVDSVGWIDKVKQKAFIQVDEKGTEAAAVTQVVWADSAPLSLFCNRPFLIVIHEDVSGAILFLGKIATPVWEE